MQGRSKTFQTFYRWHRWLGIFLSLHLVILLLTGSILVFRPELEAWLEPAGEQVMAETTSLPELSFQQLIDQATQQFPNDRPLALFIDEENASYVQIRLGMDQSKEFRGARRLKTDRMGRDASTAIQSTTAIQILDQILILHREFFLGNFGKYYVAVIGCLFVLSLISGLYIYGPLMKKLAFAWIRKPSLPRWSDYHKFFGVFCFAWCLLIAFTGSILAVSGTLLKVYQYTELRQLNRDFPDPRAYETIIPLDIALKQAQAAVPELEFSFVSFPDNEFSTKMHYLFFMKGSTPLTEKLRTLVLVDAFQGGVDEVRELPWYLSAALLSEPLHFGDYGGLGLKIIWAFLGLLSLSMPLTGMWILWLKSRKTRVRKHQPNLRHRPPSHGNWRGKAYRIPACIGLSFTIGSIVALIANEYGDLLAIFLFLIPLFLSAALIFSDRYQQRKKSLIIKSEVHQ